jgi:excinuclease ABC subunit C
LISHSTAGLAVSEDVAFDPKTFLKSLTHRPGIYRMLNAKGKVIYVGKAGDLRKRVSSYFSRKPTDAKTASMMQVVEGVEVTVTNTETEALILEFNLIKEHKPRFNVILRDDKSYPYIYVSTDHAFPRLRFHRGPRKGKGRYFGPYPSTSAVRKTLNELQKLFMIRQCQDSYFRNRSRPCLQYQIKRCTAPCVGYVDEKTYAADIDVALGFLEGKNRSIIDTIVARMEAASEAKDYEQAARFRDQISRLKKVEAEQLVSRTNAGDLDVLGVASMHSIYCVTMLFIRGGKVLGSRDFFPKVGGDATDEQVLNGFLPQYYLKKTAPSEIIVDAEINDQALLETGFGERSGHKVAIKHRVRGDRLRWLELARTNAAQGVRLHIASNATIRKQFDALGELLQLESAPARLECFDVSHTSGEATVASCVVFNQAGPLKSDYRRFNLTPASGGDDYAAMAEALRRRYERVKKGEVPMPDILFVDGGKGQLAEALTVLDKLELEWLQVVAVAKGKSRKPGMEQLFLAGQSTPTILPSGRRCILFSKSGMRHIVLRSPVTGKDVQKREKRHASKKFPGWGRNADGSCLSNLGGYRGFAAQVSMISSRFAGSAGHWRKKSITISTSTAIPDTSLAII